MDSQTLARKCGNCACLYSVTIGEGKAAQTHHVCRLNPPVVVQQRIQNQVLTTGRGEQSANVAALLTYPPTVPELVCWHWRPLGLEPGENMENSWVLARNHVERLRAAQQAGK